MSKNNKTLLVAFGVLLLLGGAYYFTMSRDKNKTNLPQTPNPQNIKLGNLKSGDLVKLQLNDIILEKNGEDWEYVNPGGIKSGIKLDRTLTGYLVYSLTDMVIERVIDEDSSDLSMYGLEKPASAAVITGLNGQKETFFLGDMTPSRTSYYFMESGNKNVYSISSYTASPMQFTLNDIRQRILFPDFETAELINFKLDAKTVKIEIIEKPSEPEYKITAPLSDHLIVSPYKHPKGTDSGALKKFLAPFNNLEIADFIDDSPASLKPYGLDDKPERIFLQTENGSLDLLLGNETDGKRYAKLHDSGGVFTLSGMEEVLNIKPFDLTDKFALIINIDFVDHISINGDGKTLNADLRGEGDDRVFYLNGKKAETDSFKDFYQAAIGLLIDAEYKGPPAPQNGASGEITIEYTLNNPPGMKASVALIPYNRDFYILKQEGSSEFLISRAQVRKIFETADAVVY